MRHLCLLLALISPNLSVQPHMFHPMFPPLNVSHFNDAYDVNKAGAFAAHFMTNDTVDNPLRVFSGDIYSPSKESLYLRGTQFKSLLETIKLHAAVIGNHEFDFGEKHFLHLKELNPDLDWLLSNVKYKLSDPDKPPIGGAKILGKAKEYKIVRINDYIVCLLGLVDQDWLRATTLDFDLFDIEPPAEAAFRLTKTFNNEMCDIVVALTHMTNESDRELMRDTSHKIDIVLGGHNHEYRIEVINDRLLLKSGFDFDRFSKLQIWFRNDPINDRLNADSSDYKHESDNKDWKTETFNLSLQRYKYYINIKIDKMAVNNRLSPPIGLKTQLENEVFLKYKAETSFPVLTVDSPVDLRADDRSFSNSLFDWFCDAIRIAMLADVSIINVGTFRLRRLIEAGDVLTGADVDTLFPFSEYTVVFKLSADELTAMLEEALNMKNDFIASAGVSLQYTSTGSERKTIVEGTLKVNGQPISKSQTYTLVTNSYIGRGRGGMGLINKHFGNRTDRFEFSPRMLIQTLFDHAKKKKTDSEMRLFKKHFGSVKTDQIIQLATSGLRRPLFSSLADAIRTNGLHSTSLMNLNNNAIRHAMHFTIVNKIKTIDKHSFFEAKLSTKRSQIVQKEVEEERLKSKGFPRPIDSITEL